VINILQESASLGAITMPLQIRRGTTAERLSITPLVGELVFDTTLSQIFVGNGTTAGGTSPNIDAETIEQALDTVGAALVNGTHQNISFTYGTVQDTANRIDATVSVSTLLENLNLNQFDIVGNGNINISGSITGNIKGSIFADDSTLLVDGTNGTIPWSVISAAPAFLTEITGSITADVTGSIFADNSTMLVDGTNGRLVGPLATSGLVSDLNLNGFGINSNVDSNIEIDTQGTGNIIFQGSLTINSAGNIRNSGSLNFSPTGLLSFGSNTDAIDGNMYITRNSYSSSFTSGFTFAQHHNTADSVNFTFYRTRGTAISPNPVQIGDELGEILFLGSDSSNNITLGASITAEVTGTPTLNNVPTRLVMSINNGTSNIAGAELGSDRTWKIDILGSLSSGSILVSSLLKGDMQGSVFADDSTLIVDGTEGGKISTPSVSISEFLQLPVFADDAARLAAIPTAAKGMVIMMTAGTTPLATNQIQFFNGTNWITL
jgi:hypothetical protein